MQYSINSLDLIKQKSDCLIVSIFQDKRLSRSAQLLDNHSQGYIQKILEKGDLIEECGKSLMLYNVPGISAPRVLLVYSGKESDLSLADFRKVISCMACILKSMQIDEITSFLTDISIKACDLDRQIRQSIELIEDCFYCFDELKTDKKNKISPPKRFIFNLPNSAERVNVSETIKQASAITQGIKLTKDLANLPANLCTPHIMAEQAKKLANDAGLTINILDEVAIKKEGMGGLLAVAQGSQEPVQFITLEYLGASEQKPVVLVGKGVTFDSGGICLKPAVGMEEMKYDMSGAASVMGILKTIAQLKLPIHVVGIMPLTENLPSGTAVKPGDVIKTLSGLSVEVINTDAEGRLILADALTYSERFNPDVVIDMATLTGAIIVALGAVATGMMSNNMELALEIEKAGQQSQDRVWSLPLWDDYQQQIDSNIADISNVGVGGGKSITAACFLSRFTKKLHWAHLDIAGTAWKSGPEKTATGRPVTLIVQFLLNRCKNNKK
ncbi:peptidase M17 [Candidatus Rickettsiella isopodorum]|jgi:leucyl aminopeptidase|uniref:Probable cytosol aminopeptidase n=1 Tax=Candidatus Rickettsiella isopodorum TaxID=1225476 RepID=A0A1J8NJB3_9COXI|nr:leucyl aminopeptidase [Candidatus Rickettsiella isopodorum]OIZ94150.1 peptidase M17 [Candidatus Rickettsiella isopodorum]